jgi:hypothetical protein
MSQQSGETASPTNENENAAAEEAKDMPHKITDFRV